jgi:hypothetical protein
MSIVSKRLLAVVLLGLFAWTSLAASPRSKAFFRSAIIPGWGELSQGNPSGWVFVASEVGLWSGRFYCLEESDLNERNSQQYAQHFAHIEQGKYDDDYYYALSKYASSGYEAGGYNESVMRRATAQGLTGDNLQDYLDLYSYSDDMAWKWDAPANRARYTEMRREITHYEDYAKAMAGFIVLNHLLSGLNAIRVTNVDDHLSFHTGWHHGPTIVGTYRF